MRLFSKKYLLGPFEFLSRSNMYFKSKAAVVRCSKLKFNFEVTPRHVLTMCVSHME